jgi:3D (Asp-Asp-Asp) domain-containing protein
MKRMIYPERSRRVFAIVIILTLGLISGLSSPKTQPKVTLLSNDITQINTASIISTEIKAKPAITPTEPQNQWQAIQMCVTAYCPCEKCCGQSADWITASGHKIQPGETFVAADKRYAFGMEMIIPGYNNDKPVKVLDRGGAIHGDRLDLFFTSHQQALNWGVKSLPVQIRRK